MEFKKSPHSKENDHFHPHSPPQLSPAATRKRKAGRRKFQETRHQVYNGLWQRKGKCESELKQPYNNKSRVWLGTFPSAEMAAKAYDVAALALRGDSASLNFLESAHWLPPVKSSSIRDSESAGMEAADWSFSGSEEDGKETKKEVFIDEEEVFNMPALLDSMAEGLILTPPAMKRGFSWDNLEDQDTFDLTLWSD